MAREIRAKYSKGKIEPLEDLELEEGQEIVISIQDENISFADQPWKRELEKAAKEAGITSEEDVIEMIHESRRANN